MGRQTKTSNAVQLTACPVVKRAGIYVRVSSEKQGEKVSPETQEADCRALCKDAEYIVIDVYRDTEKYRVGKRLVEPSGTRNDRPQFKRMLADARAGRLDVIVAWREDRLYRAYRPMLDVSDLLEENAVEVVLVKETFDKRMMGGKAWIAKMELDAKHDRLMMGVAGRLAEGKPWNNVAPYGFCKQDDRLEADPIEAHWVKQIWRWYGGGMPAREIRRRLIAAGAPQKQQGEAAQVAWHMATIYRILRMELYTTGKYTITWDGETYEMQVPILIDAKTAAQVNARKSGYKQYPAGNLQHEYLTAGLAHCKACDVKLSVQTRRRKKGKLLKTPVSSYRCHKFNLGYPQPECCHNIGAKKLDAQVWAKVWALFSDPDELERQLQNRIAELQAQQRDAQIDCEKLTRQFDELQNERQQIITWGRKKIITEKDMATQLAGLDWQQAAIQGELNQAQLLTGDRAAQLIALAENYRQEVTVGRELLALKNRTPEQDQDVLDFKRKIIGAFVTRVDVLADKSIEVHGIMDLSEGTDQLVFNSLNTNGFACIALTL